MDRHSNNERRSTTGNKRLAKKRVQCLNEALFFVSSSVLADSLVLRNPLLRQAPKRYSAMPRDKNGASKIGTFACRANPSRHQSKQKSQNTDKTIRLKP